MSFCSLVAPSGIILSIIVISCIFAGTVTSDNSNNNAKLKESVNQVGDCIVDASNSFIYESSYPPTSQEQFNSQCKKQAEAMKCIKEKSKSGMPGIIKRGLITFVNNRQRFHKKYCTNVNSELSKSYVNGVSCIMKNESVFKKFRDLDSILSNKAVEIERRNYNDSAIELKHICCTLYTYRKGAQSAIGTECAQGREKIEELVNQNVPDDISILCEDEEKLITKVCPNLDKLNVSDKFDVKKGPKAAGLMLYLVATLGEPAARR